MDISRKLLARQDCVLLLVDIQRVLLEPCVDWRLLVKHSKALIGLAQVMGLPILFTTQNAMKLGGVVPELLEGVHQPQVLDKSWFSCFREDAIAGALEKTSRKTLLLAGLEAHVCIFQTGVHALKLGYTIHVAGDAVSSRSEWNRTVGLKRLERAGALISSTEMIIYELLGVSGTDEFRKLLPLLRSL